MSSAVIKEIEVLNAVDFVLGGKAEFTVKNLNNSKCYKYKVSESKKQKGLFYVSVMESGAYKYAGYLVTEPTIRYAKGKNGFFDIDSEPVKGLMYSIRAGHSPLNRPMIMYHHGKCACCGKKLNDEISTARGFGPICWERILKEAK